MYGLSGSFLLDLTRSKYSIDQPGFLSKGSREECVFKLLQAVCSIQSLVIVGSKSTFSLWLTLLLEASSYLDSDFPFHHISTSSQRIWSSLTAHVSNLDHLDNPSIGRSVTLIISAKSLLPHYVGMDEGMDMLKVGGGSIPPTIWSKWINKCKK